MRFQGDARAFSHREYMAEHLLWIGAPTVLTIATTPPEFERSDGLKILTESLLAAKILEPRVWVAMHNEVFPIDRVRKDREMARFVWK